MRNLIKTFIVVMLSFSHAVIAGDLEDGFTAARKGDFATSIRLWTPLAEQGDAAAQLLLGTMYNEGKGVAQDFKTAVKWYTLAAEQGNASAQFNLGRMYEKGNNIAQDYNTAVKWYTLSAEQENASAQFNLGLMYDEGKGVAQDFKTAVKWYTLAAEQGHAQALFRIGLVYDNGKGVAQDFKRAIQWYTLSAEQGYASAQTTLGLMYAQGQGVAQDYVKAHMWLNIAAIDGNDDALKSRKIVATQMIPAQIAEAQKAASLCIKQNFKNCDFSIISTNSTSINDEIYQDALVALKEFDSSYNKFGMTGIAISTIPDCYKKIKKNSSYRAVRVCGMIDLWSASIERNFGEMFNKLPNEELSIFKFIQRLEKAKRYLNDEDRIKLGDGKNWLKFLNEVSLLHDK